MQGRFRRKGKVIEWIGMRLFSRFGRWIGSSCLRCSGFLTGFQAVKKIRHPGQGRIRKILQPGNNIIEQLAVFGGLFFICFQIAAAQEIIHGQAQAIRQGGDGRMGGHPLPGFPEGNGALGDSGQLAEVLLG